MKCYEKHNQEKKDQQEPLQDAAAPRPAGLTGLPNRQWKFKKIIPPAARSAMQGPSGVAQALMAQEDGPKNGQNDMRRSPTCVIKVSKAIGLEQKPTDTALSRTVENLQDILTHQVIGGNLPILVQKKIHHLKQCMRVPLQQLMHWRVVIRKLQLCQFHL